MIPKLIDVLRDSNIEDIDLSKVAAKALHNMTQIKQVNNNHVSQFWSNDSITRLEEVLTNLGDELDSIMVSFFFQIPFLIIFVCTFNRMLHKVVKFRSYRL